MKVSSPVLLGCVRLPEVNFSNGDARFADVPVIVSGDTWGTVTCRLRLSWKERLAVLLGGNLWLQIMSAHQKLQPFKIYTRQPQIEECL